MRWEGRVGGGYREGHFGDGIMLKLRGLYRIDTDIVILSLLFGYVLRPT